MAPEIQPDSAGVSQLQGLPAIAGGLAARDSQRPLVFGAPEIGTAEIDAVTACLRSGWIGSGPRVAEFEREFARYKGVPYAAAVSSGTAALHLALVAMGIGSGDEVIVPTMTYCSTVHAIVHAGAKPVLVDCEASTSNIDAGRIERNISPRTKAIVVVHMAGRCCDMDHIGEIARRRGLRLIEDCAHALESSYHGSAAGTMGDVGCFSFYPTKSITTGDGGMLIVSDKRLHRRIKILSMQGMTTDAWIRTRRTSRNRTVAAGFKYNMTDISAALGLAQLPQVEARWRQRQEIWNEYNGQLKDLPVGLPAEPEPHTRHAYHLYSVVLGERFPLTRRELVAALRAENIGSGIHFEPVHRQPYYRRRFGYQAADFPAATRIGERTISLPLCASMKVSEAAEVSGALYRIAHHFSANQGSPAARSLRERVESYALSKR